MFMSKRANRRRSLSQARVETGRQFIAVRPASLRFGASITGQGIGFGFCVSERWTTRAFIRRTSTYSPRRNCLGLTCPRMCHPAKRSIAGRKCGPKPVLHDVPPNWRVTPSCEARTGWGPVRAKVCASSLFRSRHTRPRFQRKTRAPGSPRSGNR